MKILQMRGDFIEVTEVNKNIFLYFTRLRWYFLHHKNYSDINSQLCKYFYESLLCVNIF